MYSGPFTYLNGLTYLIVDYDDMNKKHNFTSMTTGKYWNLKSVPDMIISN